MTLKSKIRKKLQTLFRLLKWKRFCKMGLNGLDDKLAPYLDFDHGVFIEAGANDGVKQSNTYYLEAVKSWKGILVEPVPGLYQKCRKNRRKSTVVNAALVSRDFKEESVIMKYADLMTMVSDLSGNENFDEQHIQNGKEIQKLDKVYEFKAKAMTLDSIIKGSDFGKIDFLSLDLEGYECEALKGLDFSNEGPKFIMLEVRDLREVLSILGEFYEVLDVLTEGVAYKDILFKRI